jgi:hypothetical protein
MNISVSQARLNTINEWTDVLTDLGQSPRLDAVVNAFGDAFANDATDLRCHQVCAVIRREMVDEWVVPLRHPALRPQLDFLDRVLDRIINRRSAIVARRLAKHLH